MRDVGAPHRHAAAPPRALRPLMGPLSAYAAPLLRSLLLPFSSFGRGCLSFGPFMLPKFDARLPLPLCVVLAPTPLFLNYTEQSTRSKHQEAKANEEIDFGYLQERRITEEAKKRYGREKLKNAFF